MSCEPTAKACSDEADGGAWLVKVAMQWARLRPPGERAPPPIPKECDERQREASALLLVREPLQRLLTIYKEGCVASAPSTYLHRLRCVDFPDTTPSLAQWISRLSPRTVRQNPWLALQSVSCNFSATRMRALPLSHELFRTSSWRVAASLLRTSRRSAELDNDDCRAKVLAALPHNSSDFVAHLRQHYTRAAAAKAIALYRADYEVFGLTPPLPKEFRAVEPTSAPAHLSPLASLQWRRHRASPSKSNGSTFSHTSILCHRPAEKVSLSVGRDVVTYTIRDTRQ